MGGLRERHKADRHRRIVEAAARLFRRSGYEGVKMDDIAAAADVSIGTIYNYYKNKGDLLVAIVSLEVNEVLNHGRTLVDDPPPDLEEAIDTLFAIYLEHSLVYLSKAMWRHAMAISTQQPDSPFGRAYGELDGELADQTCAMIATLMERGLVRADVDDRAVGEMIFNNMNMMFMLFVKDEDMSLAELRRRVRAQNRPLLNALAT